MGKYSWKKYREEKPKVINGIYDIVIELSKETNSTAVVRDCIFSDLAFKQIDTKETFNGFDTIEYRLQE